MKRKSFFTIVVMLISLFAFSGVIQTDNTQNTPEEEQKYYIVTIKGDLDDLVPREGGVDVYCDSNPSDECYIVLVPYGPATGGSSIVLNDANQTTYDVEDGHTTTSAGSVTIYHYTLR